MEITWVTSPPVHDYVIAYTKVKSSDDVLLGFKASEQYIEKTYNHDDNDGKGPWTTSDLSANHEGPYFEITNPSNGAKHWPPKGRYWVFNEKEVATRIADGRIIFGIGGTAAPIQKKYLRERGEIRLKPESWWDQHGYNSDGTNELFELFDIPKIFVNSKPTSMLKKVVEVSTSQADIILDFFAGSGSTAHAIFSQNALDKSQRIFVSVQLDEHTSDGSEAKKAGYNSIFEITRERIQRAAKKVQKDNPDAACDFGFKEFKTIPANDGVFAHYLDDADAIEDYVPFDGMALDDEALNALLTTWKVFDGLPLHQDLLPIDLGGYTAHLGEHILYFVDKSLELKHITEMLRRIDEEDSFAPRKLVVFHHVFGDKILREFSEAVNAPNRKHLELTFEQRF